MLISSVDETHQNFLNAEKQKKQQSELKPAGKRAFTTFIDDDNFADSENADPSIFSVKKTMMLDGGVAKRSSARFNIFVHEAKSSKPSPASPVGMTRAPPSTPRPIVTPKSPTSRWNERLCDYQPPFGMYSRPAGRSPVTKKPNEDNGRVELCKPMTTLEYKEHFGIIATPRSIDEMLSAIPTKPGAITPAVAAATPKSKSKMLAAAAAAAAPGKTEKRCAARATPVVVREDTAQEESANIMHHRAETLGLCSDDDESSSIKTDGRGKENIPPTDYMPSASPPRIPQLQVRLDAKGRRIGWSPDVVGHVVDHRSNGNRAALGSLSGQDIYAGIGGSAPVILEDEEER